MQTTLAELIAGSATGRRIVRALGARRTADIVADVTRDMRKTNRIVDIGAGSCDVAAQLVAQGYDVTPVDVRNLSCVEGLRPIVYDGKHLPFSDSAFDVALLIGVLHHTANPDAVLAEAARVASRIVIMEDIYRTGWQRLATVGMDSVTNVEFVGHPHSNRDDAGWRRAFSTLGLEVVEARTRPFWGLFLCAVYVVEVR